MVKGSVGRLDHWVPSPLKKKSKAKRKLILINERAAREQQRALRYLHTLQREMDVVNEGE
jgi:hypothetical protein